MSSIDKETRTKFYESFGKTENAVTEDVRTVKKWLETQKHLPEIMAEEKIRNMLHLCKFDIKKTKERIDNYYTFRGKYPNVFSTNPKSPPLIQTMDNTYMCTHTEQLDGGKVLFVKTKEKNVFSAINIIKLFFAIFEIRLQEDLVIEDIVICDMANVTLKDIFSVSPMTVFTGVKIYKNAFSLRMRAAHLINSPPYVSIWMALFKLVFPAKIFSRFQVHKDSQVLKELFSHDILPKDYGGNGPLLEDLNDIVKQKFVEYEERFDLLDSLRVDENLRK